MFILLKDTVASKDAEVEFRGSKRRMRVKPVHWNEHILCVNTAGELKFSGVAAYSRATFNEFDTEHIKKHHGF